MNLYGAIPVRKHISALYINYLIITLALAPAAVINAQCISRSNLKAQVHSKNNLLLIEPKQSAKPIKTSLSKI